jgi:hypothetical protein
VAQSFSANVLPSAPMSKLPSLPFKRAVKVVDQLIN